MIRLATEADLPQIMEIYRPYVENTTHTFEYHMPTLEEFTLRFQTVTAKFPWLVWQEEGRILGYAYGSTLFERAAYGWCAEVSIYLCPQAQGRGIGRKLYTALEKILALQGFLKNYAIITSENSPSLAFHKSLGYAIAAEMPGCAYKFGKKLGIVWMEKELKDFQIPSKFPDMWPFLRQDAEKFTDILDILSL